MLIPTQDPIAYLFSLEQFGIKLGLTTIRHLVTSLGSPDRTFHTILVAGTNGKGSVAAMVEHGLRASGLRVGLFTSPHLVDINERFMLNGKCVDTTTLTAGAQRIRETVETSVRNGDLKYHPTFFEATTALAFLLFEQASIDVAVVEVGMGWSIRCYKYGDAYRHRHSHPLISITNNSLVTHSHRSHSKRQA